ncbi:MAG: hypothetical protein COU35_03645 [Candidatus Magasanikbacteria bacterium CG10_big_fil_rev_8_21_14_0_10_47_10]|uniref:Phosphoribosyltransferase domain-containing protein n=1 Tax=Candidatus Magasanikbacteria bacterium CG10_big_fil_rev_8_21_14_0_10_47_10 TaxID=1974652 RepID=A0A2H0TQ10_9BACT|nr:MAG: hypothetical protein COU35_03645 [Candidatus Magasanikbacteria bacterium CG10_big_fil_rev_8_21_14_0_10_47_10]
MGVLSLVAEYMFPQLCVACKKEGTSVCGTCLDLVSTVGTFFYPKNSSLAYLAAVGEYDETGVLSQIIQALKYSYIEQVEHAIAQLIGDWFARQDRTFEVPDLIVPVPLHRQRYAERGFNQADVIANCLARVIDVPQAEPLMRKKKTKQQAKLDKTARLQNVSDAFVIRKGAQVDGKHILVVDDVYTTGATMGECAEILHRAGASRVTGFVLAKGE